MVVIVTLPAGFEYVGGGLLLTAFLILGQSFLVSKYRKRAGIPYPQLYAEKSEAEASKDAYLFNCAQRAHQNTLENINTVYLVTILSGIRYPIYAATSCVLWTLSRISYTRGYVQGDPKKRVTPLYMLGTISILGELLTSTYVVGGWLYAGFASKYL
ncbi:hypothetical protein CPC08DRAFT_704196 [Agrocybe pediades]|nr:hypothetical protein CPC08DRAFT_704196 [Agrocybe pediades]